MTLACDSLVIYETLQGQRSPGNTHQGEGVLGGWGLLVLVHPVARRGCEAMACCPGSVCFPTSHGK